MARSQASDYLSGMRFGVSVNLSTTPYFSQTQAGFNSVTTPEVSQDAVEYREGNWIYTRKYPGVPTYSDVTMTRGMTRTDTVFFDWMMRAQTGEEYRADVTIYHLHRDEMTRGDLNAPHKLEISWDQAKQYILHEAFPIRCKIAGDLDATTADISIGELDVAYEYFTVKAPKVKLPLQPPITIPTL